MKALGSVGVPVPKTLALCEDSRLVNNKINTFLPKGFPIDESGVRQSKIYKCQLALTGVKGLSKVIFS